MTLRTKIIRPPLFLVTAINVGFPGKLSAQKSTVMK